ncbi:MAG: hypothetical protein R3E96_02125 [Planctomycetota bacterium]
MTGESGGRPQLLQARSRELFVRPSARPGWFELALLAALLLLALLAWLAKRWTTFEVIYRCVLVSLLVHALLLWWFRDVHPRQDPFEAAAQAGTFEVRLAASPSRQDARQSNAADNCRARARRHNQRSQAARSPTASPRSRIRPARREPRPTRLAAPLPTPATQATPAQTPQPDPAAPKSRLTDLREAPLPESRPRRRPGRSWRLRLPPVTPRPEQGAESGAAKRAPAPTP